MRLRHTGLLALLLAPAPVTAQGSLGTDEDRIAVEDVMARDVWAVEGGRPSMARRQTARSWANAVRFAPAYRAS